MDPITFSIIRHRLFRVVEEAVITLKHVSGSAITNEGHDLMVSLYQADGSLLMGGVGFLHHLTSAAEACKAIIRRFGGQIAEGDMFLLNDPYTAALHTSDIYLVSPIHHGGKLVAWSACFVHVSDIGAMNPGGFAPDAQDIFTEGFSSPGIKIIDRGELRQDLWDTILNMVRSPEMVALDLRSMIACNNVARERMLALIDKYGTKTVDEACAALINQSEVKLRERLRELPNGRWQSRQYLEVKGEIYKVLLTMTKAGRHADLRFHRLVAAIEIQRELLEMGVARRLVCTAVSPALLRHRLERRRHPADQDDRAGRNDRELHAAGAGFGGDRRRDPVGQQCRLLDHRQDAGGERKIRRRGDRGLARQPFRDLHVRQQSARPAGDRHSHRNLRRRRRRADFRRRRRHGR